MVWNFLIAVFFLFIPPYGWIITLLFFLGTILYYATGADLLDQPPQRKMTIRVTVDRISDDDSVYIHDDRFTHDRERLTSEEGSLNVDRDFADDSLPAHRKARKEKPM